jgi:dCMP deaminase
MDQKWKIRWIKLAHEVATWSKDTTQVGAVVFDQNRNPRGFGYNGVPRRLQDQAPERLTQPLKSLYFEHAERNVIYAAARTGIPLESCELATTHFPCCDCARAIIQSGIKCVWVDAACMESDGVFYQRWQDQIEQSQIMMTEAGVHWELVHTQESLETSTHKDT